MPISQTARDNQRANDTNELEDLGAQAQNLIDDFFDSPTHRVIKTSVFGQLVGLLQHVDVTGSVAPAQLLGTNSVLQLAGAPSNAAALPGGSASANDDDIVLTGDAAAKFRSLLQGYNGSADQLVENFHSLLGSLSGVSSTQVAARSSVIAKVADGTISVKDNGKLKLQEDFDTQSRALSDEQAKVQTWGSRFGTLERKLRTGNADDTVYGQRLLGLHDLASLLVSPNNGGLNVAADGHVTLPTPATRPAPAPTGDALAALTDLVNHGKYSGRGDRQVFDVRVKLTDLQTETVTQIATIKAP